MKFRLLKYKDIGKIRSGKRLPKGFTVSATKTNNKYIRVRDMNSGMLNVNEVQYISDDACKTLSRYQVKSGDIIISVVGTVGLVCEIPESLNNAYLTENCDNLLVNEKLCLKKYLKYYLQSPIGKKEIISHIVGSTQPKLPIYGIEDFKINIPEIELQEKIIKLLDSINSKIEINNQINNNLCNIT